MAHNSLGNSVAGKRHLCFSSRYVGVLFAYLLESLGWATGLHHPARGDAMSGRLGPSWQPSDLTEPHSYILGL